MKLSYPVNNPTITQRFGENPIFYSDPKYGRINGHNGIDFSAYHGQPVYATHDGQAQFEMDNSAGRGVVIVSPEGFKTIYWHLCDSSKEPQYASPTEKGFLQVQNGDLIGYADNTGASTGDHLHFGLKLCDEHGVTLNSGNGYLGAIDPTPFFDGFTPYQINNLRKQVGILQQIVNLFKNFFKK